MFRALTKDSREVRGYHCECDSEHYIFTIYRIGKSCSCCDVCDCPEDSIETTSLEEINSSTLGLETGQLDKNKVEIVGGWGPGIEKGGDTCLYGHKKKNRDIGIISYEQEFCAFGCWLKRLKKPTFYFVCENHEITGWKAKENT